MFKSVLLTFSNADKGVTFIASSWYVLLSFLVEVWKQALISTEYLDNEIRSGLIRGRNKQAV